MPRRYKLIKIYPNSPDLGYEISERPGTNMFFYNGIEVVYPNTFPEFWQLIKEEPKVWFCVNNKTWDLSGSSNKAVVESYKQSTPEWIWFETEKERDLFVLDNKPQFTGQQMKDFAMYHYYDDFDVETSLNNFLQK